MIHVDNYRLEGHVLSLVIIEDRSDLDEAGEPANLLLTRDECLELIAKLSDFLGLEEHAKAKAFAADFRTAYPNMGAHRTGEPRGGLWRNPDTGEVAERVGW